jgi:hypothetical protein
MGSGALTRGELIVSKDGKNIDLQSKKSNQKGQKTQERQ